MTKITLANLANLTNEVTATATINSNNGIISTAMDNTLSRDGTAPNQMGAPLDMNSNRIINLPTAVGNSDPVTLSQLTTSLVGLATTPGTAVVSAAMQPVVASPTIAGASALLIGNAGSNPNFRFKLITATTFYVATTGNDSTGTGTSTNPWATPTGAYNNLKNNYDCGGNSVTIQIADGTYTGGINVTSPLLGQNAYVLFRGNLTNPQNVLMQPLSGGPYACSVAYGAWIGVQGMMFDMHNNCDTTIPGRGADTMAIGFKSQVELLGNIIFGDNLVQFNDVSVNGILNISGNYTIQKTNTSTTGTWTSGSNSITVAVVAGLKLYMGVVGTGIPAGAYISNISGNVISLGYVLGVPVANQATTQSGTNTYLQFCYGGQCHIDVGTQGQVNFETNNDPNATITVTLAGGYMLYSSGFIYASQLSLVYAGGITFAPNEDPRSFVSAVPFYLRGLSDLEQGSQGSFYLPGSVGASVGITTTAGSNTIVGSTTNMFKGNVVTVFESVTATYSAGATVLNTSGVTLTQAGWRVVGPGIPNGTTVSAVSGNNVTLSHVTTAGTGGSPGSVFFKDAGNVLPIGVYVTRIVDPTHFTISDTALTTGNATAWCAGIVQSGSVTN